MEIAWRRITAKLHLSVLANAFSVGFGLLGNSFTNLMGSAFDFHSFRDTAGIWL
jgi:hypothetical protein